MTWNIVGWIDAQTRDSIASNAMLP